MEFEVTPRRIGDDLEFFRTVAASPSLTAAARELGTSLPSVSKRLARLEERLGVRLARRTTRRIDLTPEGELFAQEAERILTQIDDLEERLVPSGGSLNGTLRVQAPLGFGRNHVAPLAAEFTRRHPKLALQLDLTTEPVDVTRTRFDVGIMLGEPPDARLVARRVMANRRIVCASPDYVERMGAPRVPQDLTGHNCIVLRANQDEFTVWRLHDGDREHLVHVSGDLASNDGEVVTDWCLRGLGLILRSAWNVEEHLREGRLVQVMEGVGDQRADVFVVFEPWPHIPRRVHAFADFIASEMPKRFPSASA
jgi:LysR family transcriptional regulator, transcriptional activator for dmlA